MSQFEVFLLSSDEKPFEPERLIEAFRAAGRIRPAQGAPSRFLYHNQDTGVFFNLWISALHIVEPVAQDPPDPDDDVGIEDETSGEAEPQDLLIPPATITLPLICPSFFGAEAIEVVWRIAEHAGLKPESADSLSTPESIREAWNSANRAAAQEQAGGGLARWSAEESAAWYSYGSARADLEASLACEQVIVPRLQAARHDGRVKSLCAWTQGVPSVLPRADIFLISRERVRRGLLLSRKVKEEGLVPGEKLWRILAPHSERRDSPVPHLIYRKASNPPQQVAADLEVLELEPVDRARRTELLGVVDFEVSAARETSA